MLRIRGQCINNNLDPDHKPECEDQYEDEIDKCRNVTRLYGKNRGESCYTSAAARYSECRNHGIGGVKTSLVVK